MLRKEQNDLLTQTGPGTPMGQMFRLSWQPALLAGELPENECPPVRVKLLGERLLAWRDTQGRYALTDEFCAHRGVSLWFGRNETMVCAAPITAGSTTTPASASRCRQSRPKAGSARRSS